VEPIVSENQIARRIEISDVEFQELDIAGREADEQTELSINDG
jgi:hypothetical protein